MTKQEEQLLEEKLDSLELKVYKFLRELYAEIKGSYDFSATELRKDHKLGHLILKVLRKAGIISNIIPKNRKSRLIWKSDIAPNPLMAKKVAEDYRFHIKKANEKHKLKKGRDEIKRADVSPPENINGKKVDEVMEKNNFKKIEYGKVVNYEDTLKAFTEIARELAEATKFDLPSQSENEGDQSERIRRLEEKVAQLEAQLSKPKEDKFSLVLFGRNII